MSSFDNFYNRLQTLTEARKSPVEALVPGAAGVTKQMRSAGLSSAPLDTIRFIRELLFNLDVISEEDLNSAKAGKGFTGKKQAMLNVLQKNQDAINAKSDEIARTIESTLDNFIAGMGANRSREEKYAAQAAAEELAAQARAARSGKEMDDALADVISDEKLIIKASLAKAIQELEDLPGGEDISPEVLNEIKNFAPKINTLEQLESFVKQLAAAEEYQIPAAYLSSTVKAIKGGLEDIEMEDQEDPDHGFDAGKSDLDGDGDISEYERKRGEAIASSISIENGEDSEGDIKKEVLAAIEDGAGEFAHTNAGKATSAQQLAAQYEEAGDDVRASIAKNLAQYFDTQTAFDENEEDDMKQVTESRYTTADYLTDIYSNVEPIVENTTWDENGGTVPVQQYLVEHAEQAIEDVYTSQYLTEQKAQDSLPKQKKEESLSFKERFQPKTQLQLEEVRRYGL
ncbi:hypothetical protein N9Z65_00105 [bacterium]|nr:hypothetical protein [bacterium]